MSRRLVACLVVVAALGAACGSPGGDLRPPESPAPTAPAEVVPAEVVPGDEATDNGDAIEGGALGEAGATVNVESTGVVPEGFATAEVEIVDAAGERRPLSLYVADTAAKQQRGLMEVTDLAGHDGMLFVFDAPRTRGFYMENTPTPLTIAYFAPDGSTVAVLDMAPCLDPDATCPLYPPGGEYQYAIEVFQGRAGELGLAPQARLVTSTLP